jgi:hypothetical protein
MGLVSSLVILYTPDLEVPGKPASGVKSYTKGSGSVTEERCVLLIAVDLLKHSTCLDDVL